ncbi:MAG: NAD(+) diphosphatase [Oscillospiraceae bacterium]|jgi:NAD+ diphosphatase|nr:NAD(+) diphosphatase [Oscillospiraceae bacterium]
MIHQIAPSVFNNQYKPRTPKPNDYIFIYGQNQALLDCANEKEPRVPTYSDFAEYNPTLTYLFEIDETAFYLLPMAKWPLSGCPDTDKYKPQPIFSFYMIQPGYMAFAGLTAAHIAGWYEKRTICGRCGAKLVHNETERKMDCPECHNEEFPQINPVVIVGVTNGDKLMLTKYANRPITHFALIAGFAEIGESFEECVAREVFEEVGIRVKNIRFYKSQPWAMSGSLLAGFYCDLDGDDKVILQEDELSEGVWVPRGEIPEQDTKIALTAEMIERFRIGKENEPL